MAGDERPRRRWPLVAGSVAAAVGVGLAVLPEAVSDWRDRRDRAALESEVRLSGGDALGSGSRADGTVLTAWEIVNEGPLPVRLRELRVVGGGLSGTTQELSDLDDLLPPGESRRVDVPLSSTDCPGAVTAAPTAQLEVVVETADGQRRTVRPPAVFDNGLRGLALVRAARLACDRPNPAQAAGIDFPELEIAGDEARGILVLSPASRPVTLLRLLPANGLTWSTTAALPLTAVPGRETRVPVIARRGDCSDPAEVASQASLGVELTVESPPGDSYREPPEISYTSPGRQADSVALDALRDRLCAAVRLP